MDDGFLFSRVPESGAGTAVLFDALLTMLSYAMVAPPTPAAKDSTTHSSTVSTETPAPFRFGFWGFHSGPFPDGS